MIKKKTYYTCVHANNKMNYLFMLIKNFQSLILFVLLIIQVHYILFIRIVEGRFVADLCNFIYYFILVWDIRNKVKGIFYSTLLNKVAVC